MNIEVNEAERAMLLQLMTDHIIGTHFRRKFPKEKLEALYALRKKFTVDAVGYASRRLIGGG